MAADELKRHQEAETRRLEEEERIAESKRQQEAERREQERLEAERLEREKRASEQAAQNQTDHSAREQEGDEHGWDDGELYEEDEDDLDGMYDDEESEADNDDAGGVSVDHPRPIGSDQTPSAGEPDAGDMERDVNANDGADLPSTEQQSAESSFFDAAAAVTSASTSMQSMFESNAPGLFGTSTAATSMFSWGGGEAVVEESSGPASDEATVAQPQQGEVPEPTETPQSEVQNDDARTDPANEHESDVSESVPQHTLDNFVKQLERMTESHQLEMDELQRTHRIEMDRLQAELDDERDTKTKNQARKEVASQDKFLKQVREMEKQCNAQLEEKENQLQEVMKRNEGMGLKLNTLKREVDGLAKLVDERYVSLGYASCLATSSTFASLGTVKSRP